MSDVLAVRGLKRSFRQGEVVIHVLNGVDLDVGNGEIVALLGPSGSGKSTLLQAVGLLEGGFEGSIRINGEEAAQLENDGRTRLRRDALGFVYQFHHLLPEFTALDNRPSLVLADEPTGNLDEKTADIVLAEFLRLVREEGSAALVATHNERLAAKMDRVVRLHEGVLE